MDNLKQYFFITIGIILVAISVEYFFSPNNLAAGGVTGAAIVINSIIPWISVGITTLVINMILFLIAFVVIGGNFGAKTMYASLGLSVILWIMEKFINPTALTNDLFMASFFGSIISAVGTAIVFNNNASTGGTDIIAKILNKFLHINIGKSLLIVDFFITFVSAIVFGIDTALYAMFSVILLGVLIDRFIEGFNSCKSIYVISSKDKEIGEYIIKKLNRGCTFLKSRGAYTHEEKNILYTVLSRNEFIKLKNYIKDIDLNAFITVGEVHEVLGEGFNSIIEE